MTMSSHGRLRHRLILLSIGVLALYYVLVSLFSIVFMEPYYLHNGGAKSRGRLFHHP